jgi:hypothetical protein
MPHLSGDMFQGTKWSFWEYAAVFWPSHRSEIPNIEGNGNALGETTNMLRGLTNTFFFRKHPRTIFDPGAQTFITGNPSLREKQDGLIALVYFSRFFSDVLFTNLFNSYFIYHSFTLHGV